MHDRSYSRQLSMGEFYDLLIAAGYDEETAQAAARQRGWDRMEAGLTS